MNENYGYNSIIKDFSGDFVLIRVASYRKDSDQTYGLGATVVMEYLLHAKEKVSAVQYVFLLGIVAGSIMVIADTVF